MKNVWCIIAALAVFGAACGGGGSDDPRVADVAAALMENSDSDFPVTEDEANCAAENIVDNVSSETVDAMLASDDPDLEAIGSAEENAAALTAVLDCIDVRQAMIDSMIADGTPQEAAECVADELDEDTLRGFIEMSSSEEELSDEDGMELFATVMGVFGNCGLGLGG